MDRHWLRFDDAATEAQLWGAQRAAEAGEASPREVALSYGAVDVIERPRLVQRAGLPGVEWSVWARCWSDQPPLSRTWYDHALDAAALQALERVLCASEAAAYEASLALELAGILERELPAPSPRRPRNRRRP